MVSAIIVAGGKGARMSDGKPKQFLSLSGLPILSHTLLVFDACREIDRIFLVVPKEELNYCHTHILHPLKLKKKPGLVEGGIKRQDSVYNGLLAVNDALSDEKSEIVVIHDGVRPFIRIDQISACINEAQKVGACILGIPAFDTLKRVNNSEYIEKTIHRNDIWLAQTPQAFNHSIIIKAHEDAKLHGYVGTDDASLVERLGKHVKIILGSRFNIKITTQEDLLLAHAILETKDIH